MRVVRALMCMAMLAAAQVAWAGTAAAQQHDVRFILDFLLQGQQSPFVLGRDRGLYAAQGIRLTAFDSGQGGADSITKVASGAYDIGTGDFSSMIEFSAKTPGRELIAVALIYDQAPLSIISLKKAAIAKPTDLAGRKGAAPIFDSTYRLFDVFARVNKLDAKTVQWLNVQPQVREPMLVRGEADFVAAWTISAIPALTGLGIKREDIDVMMLRDNGLDLYSNVVFTTPAFAKRNPEAVRAFVKATLQAWIAAAADPAASIAVLKQAQPMADPAVEAVRLDMALQFVVSPHVRQAGIGAVETARLAKHIDIISEGFQLPRKLTPDQVFDASFLPPLTERRIAR